jgi:hypothetical protein
MLVDVAFMQYLSMLEPIGSVTITPNYKHVGGEKQPFIG